MIAEIQLTKGYKTAIDAADMQLVSGHKWWAHPVKRTGMRDYVYAAGSVDGKIIRLHRFLMGLKAGDKLFVDHIDGDTLNNTRANLRICSVTQNNWNSSKPINSSSRYKGVQKWRDGWTSSTVEQRKKKHLGVFKNEVLAGVIYNNYIRSTRGEFARPNLIRYEEEINTLLDQKAEIERQIELLCAMELEQV